MILPVPIRCCQGTSRGDEFAVKVLEFLSTFSTQGIHGKRKQND
jgi:hypothetical protein